MSLDHYHANATVLYPLRNLFAPFPFVSFIFVLFCDTLYWRTSNLMWSHFSSWLLFFGLVFGALGIIAGLIDLLRPRRHRVRPSLFQSISYLLVLLIALFNSLVHAGDGWTAVVPTGLVLSFITVVFIVVTVGFAASETPPRDWRNSYE